MARDTDRIVEDLQKLVVELETLIARAGKGAGEQIGDHLDDAEASLRGVLETAQRRIEDLQAKLERRVGRTTKALNETVRENPWATAALGAATALFIGFALARGSNRSKHERDSDAA